MGSLFTDLVFALRELDRVARRYSHRRSVVARCVVPPRANPSHSMRAAMTATTVRTSRGITRHIGWLFALALLTAAGCTRVAAGRHAVRQAGGLAPVADSVLAREV